MNAQSMQRPYKRFTQRIEELERIARLLVEEVQKVEGAELVFDDHDGFVQRENEQIERKMQPTYRLDEVETAMTTCWTKFQKARENNRDILARVASSTEEQCVLSAAASQLGVYGSELQIMNEVEENSPSRRLLSDDDRAAEGSRRAEAGMVFSNMAGVIEEADRIRFEATLFRATRGNTYTHFQPLSKPLYDPESGKFVNKSVFVVYFQGGVSSAMRSRVDKICKAFGARVYEWPNNIEAARTRLTQVESSLREQQLALDAYQNFTYKEVDALCELQGWTDIHGDRHQGNSLLAEWQMFCAKEKGVYANINCLEGQSQTLRAHIWYPEEQEDRIRHMLLVQSNLHDVSAMLIGDRVSSDVMPPTYMKTNALTEPFQFLVDMYGIPRYQEVNPALFTVITFPFFFGVMYGDILHGMIVFCFGLYLIFFCGNLTRANMLSMVRPYRYVFALMGFFAIYAGFMYNDIAAVGVDLFGSHYKQIGGEYIPDWVHSGSDSEHGPYPFGLDPIWKGSANELIFVNSLKMKLSVLFGVLQMLLGIFLKFANAFHFRNWIDLFCECVPQLIFMVTLFGYMDFLIMYKWVTPDLENQPSIINTMINMALGSPIKDAMWSEQDDIQWQFLGLCLICVPWMLIPKPILEHRKHQLEHALRHNSEYTQLDQHEDGEWIDSKDETEQKPGEEHSFADNCIHQMIETIEYVLGSVSHTASYLRCWALSLAHQQLSMVFLQKTVYMAMVTSAPWNAISIFFGFGMLMAVTFVVLIIMDQLECFLHTLRLHWVEFQSKFFKADGWAFKPYSHRGILVTFVEEQ